MKSIITSLVALMIGTASLHAQYTITLNDNTRVTVDDNRMTFTGEGETDGSLVAGDVTLPLSTVASVDPADTDAPKPYVIAYHPYYAGSDQLPPADMVTHINYSFAEVYVKNGVYTGFKLQGSRPAFNRTIRLKEQNPNLKILLSFTHSVVNSDNKQDGGFSAIAASEEYRKKFAEDCVAYMQANNLDGIDMDWEFPGLSWSGAACDPAVDVDNYTLLIKQMRETFDAASATKEGDPYLLTFAGYCMDKKTTTGGWKYIDLAAVEPYVDFVNLMTYDFAAAPGYHNAIKSSTSYWDIDRTIKAYKKAGFPMNKMVLGVPFYLRNNWETSLPYSKLNTLKEEDGYKIDNWNETAQVPYVTKDGKMYGSYDNPRSIECKAKYSASLGLRGMFYWCSYEDDKDRTLSKALWRAVMLYMR